jgi:hypothetical protein
MNLQDRLIDAMDHMDAWRDVDAGRFDYWKREVKRLQKAIKRGR